MNYYRAPTKPCHNVRTRISAAYADHNRDVGVSPNTLSRFCDFTDHMGKHFVSKGIQRFAFERNSLLHQLRI